MNNSLTIPSTLSEICKHYPYGEMPRWSCEKCIRDWVMTVSVKETEEAVKAFREKGMAIATERLEVYLKIKTKKEKGLL